MKIKYFLLFLLAGIQLGVSAQQLQFTPGDTLYYSISGHNELDSNHSVAQEYITKINVLNRHANRYDLQCTLLYILFKNRGSSNFYFRSDDINSLPSDNDLCLSAIALLNKPVQFSMNTSGKQLEIQNLDSVATAVLNKWHLPENVKQRFEKRIRLVLNTILSPIVNESLPAIRTDMQLTSKKLNKKPNVSSLDREQLLVRIWMSSYSDSLKTGSVYDSPKIMHFLAMNDKKFSGDSAYIMDKLHLLSSALHFKAYYEVLDNTPIWTIRSSWIHLFNKLQRLYKNNPDSALTAIRYFYKTNGFNNWVHDIYAQTIKNSMYRENCQILLSKLLSEPDSLYQFTLRPMQLWIASIQTGDAKKLDSIATAFEKLGRKYLWIGRSARYGMMIYEQLNNKGMKKTADTLINRIALQLEKDQQDSLPGPYITKITGNHKLIHRNLLAHAFYLKYKNADDSAEAIGYLGKAALYSPKSAEEKNYENLYDHSLLHSKKSYRADYAKALIKSGKQAEGLKVLTKSLQANPLMVEQVRSMYNLLLADSSFPVFFKNAVVEAWKKAPNFRVKDIQGNSISLDDYRGKWLLLDFWGTWCLPCREEMPDVQAFFDRLKKENRQDISLLTIACYDSPDQVKNFLRAFQYAIPVAMAGDAIIKKYKVPGYPAKILISPDGTWLPINPRADWEEIVKKYTALYKQYTQLKKEKQESHVETGILN